MWPLLRVLNRSFFALALEALALSTSSTILAAIGSNPDVF